MDPSCSASPLTDVLARLAAILEPNSASPQDRAQACARLFAETTRDGVYSHGVNRFPRFVATIRNGSVDPAAEPACTASFGALERWDGRRRSRQPERPRRHESSHRPRPPTRHRLHRPRQHQPLDARRHLRLAGRRRRPHRPLLDQHHAQPAALGRRQSRHRQQPAGPRRPAPRRTTSCWIWPCRSSLTARSSPTAAAASRSPSPAASTPPANSPAIPPPSKPRSARCPSATGKAPASPSFSTPSPPVLALGNATHQLSTDPLRESALSQTFIAHPSRCPRRHRPPGPDRRRNRRQPPRRRTRRPSSARPLPRRTNAPPPRRKLGSRPAHRRIHLVSHHGYSCVGRGTRMRRIPRLPEGAHENSPG